MKTRKLQEENLVQYNEVELTPANLLAYNDTGALNADGTPTGEGVIRFKGIPYSDLSTEQ